MADAARYVRYAWWLPTRAELRTAWLDAQARRQGYCNNCPGRVDNSGNGYTLWRCGLARKHKGHHRLLNYIWDGDGKITYRPPVLPGPDVRQIGRPTLSGASWWLRLARQRHEMGAGR